MKDYDSLINSQGGIIHNEKNLLSDTDYQVIREMEGGAPISATLSERRSLARTRINNAEAEIKRLKQERDKENESLDLLE